MQSLKLPIACATMLATLSAASLSFADDAVVAPAAPTPAPVVAAPPTKSTTTTTSADTESTAVAPVSTPRYDSPTTTLVESRRPNRPWLIVGGALFASTYVTTAAVAGGVGSIRDHDLYIPVAGPWINLATRGTDQPTNTRDTLLIGGSGVLQGIGLGMVVTSFIIPEKVAGATISAGPVKMLVTPTASAGAGGVGAVGTF